MQHRREANLPKLNAGLLSKSFRILSSFCLVLVLAGSCLAQVDRSALNGTVTDPSGRVLPGAEVVAVQDATGLRRTTVSSGGGTYEIPELPVGLYTVTFRHDGFQPLTFANVVQELSSTRTLNASLKVGAAKEQVEVPWNQPPLDQTTNSLGVVIESEQVEELPLNGRNWANLTTLVPAAIDTGGSNQRSVRFAGRGRDDNNFTYDGIDATNVINQAQQPYVRLAIPLGTIEEFRVDPLLATAEEGATGGGQLAVTSSSGTNAFHGSVFEFLRNNVFDARQPIDNLNPEQPPFQLNQFGGTFGGPIIKDKTFFFVSYEGYRQRLGQTLPGFVPNDALRAEILATSPALAPIVNGFPHGQTPLDANTDTFVAEGSQNVNEDSGMFRIDHRFSEKTTAFVRATIDEARSNVPLGTSNTYYLNDQTQSTSSPVNSVVELMHVFSPTLIDEVKFGFNRSTAINTNVNTTGLVYAISSPFTTLNNNRLSTGVGNSFSVLDNLTWIKGKHVLKAGAEVRRIQMNQGSSSNGKISFPTVDALVNDQVSSASLTGTQPILGLRKTQVYGYIQDEFKMRSNLTLNLGARHSFFGMFHEADGRSNPFDFATCGPQGFCGVGASFGQPNYADIDPRIAFAWAPERFGAKTVIRGGFGIYHEDGQLDDQNLPNSNIVLRYSLSSKSLPDLSFPIDPFLDDTTGIVSPRAQDRKRKDTYVTQWGFSVQQALPSEIVGTISYVGSKGTHLLTLSEVNVIDPLTGTRPYPDFGQIDWRGTENNSSYQGLSVAVRRSFSHGVLFAANYIWSHEIDDGSNGSGDGDSLVAQNVSCMACERASGAFDARHVLNFNAIYQLPFGAGKSHLSSPGILRTIFGSWEVSSLVNARTGFPLNVTIDRSSADTPDGNTNNQRPDLVPGVSLTPPGGQSIGAWINPAAFATPASGTWGNAPRNLLRAPGAWQIDAGLSKGIPLTERVRLQFRTDIFNILNHPQYGSPTADVSAKGFGQIASTINIGPVGTGTARQVQFALRLEF
jgi:Carboxypeptidase regulatory-like domain